MYLETTKTIKAVGYKFSDLQFVRNPEFCYVIIILRKKTSDSIYRIIKNWFQNNIRLCSYTELSSTALNLRRIYNALSIIAYLKVNSLLPLHDNTSILRL